MQRSTSLNSLTLAACSGRDPFILCSGKRISWHDAARAPAAGDLDVAGKAVLISTSSQLSASRAMLALDGVASRMVVAPPDFNVKQIGAVCVTAKIDVVLCDEVMNDLEVPQWQLNVSTPLFGRTPAVGLIDTDWVLPTSGTTGAAKLVSHRIEGLLGPMQINGRQDREVVWGTFYDIRRYGGLQIFLRAATGGSTLVLGEAGEALEEHLSRMASAGCTHISGTPTHWRRVLMSGEASKISPKYIRLSGEIADSAILRNLRGAFPRAEIVHAYASTEAGVGFEVSDGREGFPASFLPAVGNVDLRVVDGSLHLRSKRTATSYVGNDVPRLRGGDGFVDSGDLVERVGDRFYFKGRLSGAINIGGHKVHPEEIEQVINRHDDVRLSLVKARRSPITGNVIAADVILKEADDGPERQEKVKNEILALCRAELPRHKIPVSVNFVRTLPMSSGGKVLRGSA